MNRFQLAAIGALAAASFALVAPGAANAAGDPAAGKQVLDELCVSKGGTLVFTPYSISRCQAAKSKEGFSVEELVCEGLLGGTFTSWTNAKWMNRSNWACIPGPI